MFSPLDRLDVEIVLLARGEVGPHDARLHPGADDAREDAPERVKSTLVRRGYHLRYVHHQRSLRITVLDRCVHRTETTYDLNSN